jgi:hypothetical protein
MPYSHAVTPLLKPIKETPSIILVPLWAVVQLVLFYWLGIKVVYDSQRYIDYAESFVSGSNYWHQHSGIFYSSYTVFITIILHFLNLRTGAVVLVQVLLSGVAALLLYKATLRYSDNPFAAFSATFLLIVWPDLQMWNFYIHTESVYIFLSVLVFYLLLKFKLNSSFFVLGTALVVAALLRPNGFFLGVGVLVFFLLQQLKKHPLRAKKLAVFLGLPAVLLLLLFTGPMLEVFNPMAYYLQGQIIQGYTDFSVPLTPPPSLKPGSPVFLQFVAVALYQPLSLLKLILLRGVFYWSQVRPYYSFFHNMLIVLFFAPIYFFAMRHMFRGRFIQPATAFVLCLVALHSAMAVFIAVDWDNRFIVPILPFIFILASAGMFHSKHGTICRTS